MRMGQVPIVRPVAKFQMRTVASQLAEASVFCSGASPQRRSQAPSFHPPNVVGVTFEDLACLAGLEIPDPHAVVFGALGVPAAGRGDVLPIECDRDTCPEGSG